MSLARVQNWVQIPRYTWHTHRSIATLSECMLEVINPWKNERITKLSCDSKDAICAKTAAAAKYQRLWSQSTMQERIALVLDAARLLKADAKGLAQLLSQETGKPLSQARTEVLAAAQRLQGMTDMVQQLQLQEPAPQAGRPGSKEQYIRWEPRGLVADISTWNYPVLLAAGIHAGALLLGNAVIYKASEHAVLASLRYVELMHAAGIPRDVLVPLIGGAEVAQTLLQQPGLGTVCFTGSRRHGQAVAQAAAAQLVPCQLELGGRDMAYVHHDVQHVARAARQIADSSFANSGQTCCAIKHVLVHQDALEQFCDSLTAHVASYKVGDPSQAGTFIGPLAVASTKQLLQEQVAAALEHGAAMLLPTDATRAAALGHPGIFPPTVLLSTSFPEVLLQQESFGPLLLVQPVPDEQAALQTMAASHHGLTAAVFSREQQLAQHMLGSLDVGTGFWNQCGEMDFRLPWSGCRASGSGCTLGLQGLHVMLRPKSYNMVGCDS